MSGVNPTFRRWRGGPKLSTHVMSSGFASLFLVALLAADPPPTTESGTTVAGEPEGGTGVSPVELIPRLELRQSFAQLPGAVSVHDTTAEIDIQFVGRVLLRYQGPLRVLSTPAGQVSGLGDIRIEAVTMVASTPRHVGALITGALLDTASQPSLGAGKQQLIFGAAVAVKPVRWWLPFVILQEQLSVGGDDARSSVNQLTGRFGNIIFGRGYSWFRLDLDTVVDFEHGAGSFFGRLEAGRLLVGRVGLFMRAATQLLGQRQLDYSVETGVRYLFRLGTGELTSRSRAEGPGVRLQSATGS